MAVIHYALALSEEALEQLRALPKADRKRVGQRLPKLQDNLSGDVKKLAATGHNYRLRVGNFRVLFRFGRPADFGVCCEGQERSI